MRLSMIAAFVCSMIVAVIGGCGSTLPRYAWSGHDAAMADLAARGEAVQSVSGSCAIYMQASAGGGASLDGAIAARDGSHLRLRAWKFNHAAFDLTLTPDGLWLMMGAGDDDEQPQISAEHIASAWSLLSGDFFHTAEEVSSTSREHIVRGRDAAGATVRCIIDRRTLTPTRFDYIDSTGTARASLQLQRYRDVDGHLWPMRMAFDSDEGSIVIIMRDIEINAEVPDAAFRPPARAVRQP